MVRIPLNTPRPKPIGLTSLVDVVFILLFFFMAIAGGVQTSDIKLSSALSVDVSSESSTERLILKADGQLELSGNTVSIDDLKIHGSKVFYLSVMPGVTVQQMLDAMHRLHSAGISVELAHSGDGS